MMFSAGSSGKAPCNGDALERDLVRERSLSAEQRERMWLELAHRFQRPIDRALTGMGIVSVHAREDLWQETLLHAFLRSAAYQPERGRLVTWLRLIAREVARRWRRERWQKVPPAEVLDGRASPPADELEGHESFEAMLFGLAPREATVLRAVYLEGLSMKEVAQRGGCTAKAVERVIARARGRLRVKSTHANQTRITGG